MFGGVDLQSRDTSLRWWLDVERLLHGEDLVGGVVLNCPNLAPRPPARWLSFLPPTHQARTPPAQVNVFDDPFPAGSLVRPPISVSIEVGKKRISHGRFKLGYFRHSDEPTTRWSLCKPTGCFTITVESNFSSFMTFLDALASLESMLESQSVGE